MGSRVRALREARGISQEDFARAAGIDRAYMGKIERGTQNISVTTAAKIAAALEISLSAMLEGVGIRDDGAAGE